MPRFNILQNVRLAVYSLKLFYTAPYFVDKNGKVKYSPCIRIFMYALYGLIGFFVLYCHAVVLRHQGVFGNAYKLLGYFRNVLQAALITCGVVWNIHQSKRAAKMIFKFVNLSKDLTLTDKQLIWTTVINAVQLIHVHVSFFWSILYVNERWGVGLNAFAKLSFGFMESSFFIGEQSFINIMVLVNRFAKILQKEIDEVFEDPTQISDVLFFRYEPKQAKRDQRLNKLNRIRSLYRKLYDIKEDVHHVFSFPLLVTTISTFGNMVFFVFVNTILFKYGSSIPTMSFVISCLYPVVLLVKLGFIIWVSDTFRYRLRNASLTSAKLFAIADNNRESEIILGLVQEMKYMDPEITCCRFAIINYQLAGSMIATVTTYAVILLQTQFEEDGSDPVKNLLYDM